MMRPYPRIVKKIVSRYDSCMDDRKKQIVELRGRIEDYRATVTGLHQQIGALVLERADPDQKLADARAEYRRLAKDHAESAQRIREIHACLETLRVCSVRIGETEQRIRELRNGLQPVDERLGRALFGIADTVPLETFSSFKTRIDEAIVRLMEIEAKIAEQENAVESADALRVLGKSVRLIGLRVSLKTSKSMVSRLFAEAGAASFEAAARAQIADGETTEAIAASGTRRNEIGRLEAILAECRTTRQETRERLSELDAAVNPRKAITMLERQAIKTLERKRCVETETGERLCALPEFAVYLEDASISLLAEKVREYEDSIRIATRRIDLLDISIRIDRLRGEAASIRRSMADLERRIEADRRTVESLAVRLAEHERTIEQLESERDGSAVL